MFIAGEHVIHHRTVVLSLLPPGLDEHRQGTEGSEANKRFSDMSHAWNQSKKAGIQPNIQT